MGVFKRLKDRIQKRRAEYKKAVRDKVNKKALDALSDEAGPSFNLTDKIEDSPYYGSNPKKNDERSTEVLESLEVSSSVAKAMIPGQLVMFKYFEPKMKEELEYYDARPVTIYFNKISTENGPRYLGFNIHYYPPKIRYAVMNKIFDIYKPVYTKYFSSGSDKEMDAFDYRYLMSALEKAKLDFGVRMYIPELVAEPRIVPPKYWEIAVFTEGWFKKRTREAILRYWKRWVSGFKNGYKKHERKKN